MRDLPPGARAAPASYRVTTVTSDLRGADTDANVHVKLHGRLRDGERHALASGPCDFERWVLDCVCVCLWVCVGGWGWAGVGQWPCFAALGRTAL